MKMVLRFKDVKQGELAKAGGKGGVLAKLYQQGYPVPDGLVILPEAFVEGQLHPEAWQVLQQELTYLRAKEKDQKFAVRSSGLSEDSADASFAGEFETVLNVGTDQEILQAIDTVYRSRENERVKAYSATKGIDAEHQIAIVVQKMIPSEISGVLFTIDPVTGHNEMIGNYIQGLGEQLVSGEANPESFLLKKPHGNYQGPAELREYAQQLFALGQRLETGLGTPQDIEWAIYQGRLYLLQSRPVTTLEGYDPVLGNWNQTQLGDYLWTNQMIGEIFPEVLTPCTWSVWELFYASQMDSEIPILGNIGGRPYFNLSLLFSISRKFMMSEKKAAAMIESTIGKVPEEVEIPQLQIGWKFILLHLIPNELKNQLKKRKLRKNFQQFIGEMPTKCERLKQEIREIREPRRLARMWTELIQPQFLNALTLQDALNEEFFRPQTQLKNTLVKLIGEADANGLLATIGGGSDDLESIGPLVGIAKVVEGRMTQAEYVTRYGHRHPNENEFAEPRPKENPEWVQQQVQEFKKNPVEIKSLVANRADQFERAWQKLSQQYPKKARSLEKKIAQIKETMHQREMIRSELTRFLEVIRHFFLQAGRLSGLEDDIFYLTFQETLELLTGDDASKNYLPVRKERYKSFKKLPAYPQYIRGQFDPVQWAEDPERRVDIYDPGVKLAVENSDIIRGNAASAGRVEGIVRRIDRPDEGDQLQPGEILVTSTTNVGWTPLFPRAKAIVTDIGAQLSHAAIVAREIGIPAVVGCRTATMRLKTGDRVIVDGSKGTVEIVTDEE